MNIIASSITDPRKFIELPIVISEQVMLFCSTIIQKSFEFAASMLRLMV